MTFLLMAVNKLICVIHRIQHQRLMERNGPHLVRLPKLPARDPPQCAVSAHGE